MTEFRLFGGTVGSALRHALTAYDRKQEEAARTNRKRHHNPYALAHYLNRVADIEADIAAGATPRAAILAAFTAPLTNIALRAVGEANEIAGERQTATYKGLPVYRPAKA